VARATLQRAARPAAHAAYEVDGCKGFGAGGRGSAAGAVRVNPNCTPHQTIPLPKLYATDPLAPLTSLVIRALRRRI
jgi:hypothetical protein